MLISSPQKNEHRGQSIKKRTIAFFLVCLITLGVTGCFNKPNSIAPAANPIQSFRDIPNITDAEIAAIEAFIASGRGFSLGCIQSTDSFMLQDGTYAGFVPKLSRLLSDIFEIPFVLDFYSFDALIDGIDSGAIDFTTELIITPERQEKYIMSGPISQRSIGLLFRSELDIKSPQDLNGLTAGTFQSGAAISLIASAYPELELNIVEVPNKETQMAMLRSGELDIALGASTGIEFEKLGTGFVFTNDTLPLIYAPIALTTASEDLKPVISVLNKYLAAGGISELYELYKAGEDEYKRIAFFSSLTIEEQAYINGLTAKVPIVLGTDTYPVSFYNERYGEFQGISVDVLAEVSKITGIEFEVINESDAPWGDLMEMLRTGEAALISDLSVTEDRKEYFTWLNTPFFTTEYLFISKADYPDLELYQIEHSTVGIVDWCSTHTVYEELFPNSENIKLYYTQDDGLDALENNEIDLFFNLGYILIYQRNLREKPDYKANYTLPFDNDVFFGFNINEQTLCSIIDKSVAHIDTEKISSDWINRTFDYRAKLAEARLPWLIGAVILSVFVLVLVIIVFIVFYKNRKASVERTAERIRDAEKQKLIVEEANHRLQTVLDLMPVGIIIIRREDNVIIYANDAALYIYGCKSFEEDAGGRSCLDFIAETQPNGHNATDVMSQLWTQHKGVVELQCVKLTGETFPARITFNIISYNDEIMSLDVIEDIAEERKRRQTLEKIALREQEANQLKSRFLATMSHEIRTPMNAIIGMTELVLRQPASETVKEHLYAIKQAGSNMLALLNDILDFSKIEAGKLEIIPGEYYVASLLNDLINIIRIRTSDSRLRFAVKADSRIPRALYGDETRIRQVLLNILNNAVKYTESGYVSFGVYAEFIDEDTVNLIFEVIDTGVGIKPEDIDKLFNDFTQVDLEKSRNIEGAGLGLAITHGIVEAMGGNITVQSEYGKGSTFTVTIPQKYHTREALAAVDSPEEKNVLVYEQSEPYADSTVYALDSLGLGYTLVKSGTELFKAMESNKYDCLIISGALYGKNEETIHKFGKDAKIAVLTELGEAVSHNIPNALTMPVYCTHIADLFGGASDDYSGSGGAGADMFFADSARVLIVDDVKTNLIVAEGLLLSYKMHVDLAESGEEAIEAVRSERYDLIFMDHKMPGIDGVEATRRIRQMGESDPHYKNVPIIALTANVVSDMIQMYTKSGFSDFLSKPIDTEKLHAILEKWIPKHKRESSEELN